MNKLKWLFGVLVLLNAFIFVYLSRLSEPKTLPPTPAALQEVNADKLRINTQSNNPSLAPVEASSPVVQSASEPLSQTSASQESPTPQ